MRWKIAALTIASTLLLGFASKEILIEIGTANGLSLSGRTLSMALADTSTTGALSDTDWDIFNGKVATTRSINTDGGLLGGGDLSADRTLSCAVASGSLAGCLSSADWTTFNNKVATSVTIATDGGLLGGGDLSADRTLSCAVASGSLDGCLASADWTTFNNKVATTRAINTDGGILGGGDLSADRTLSCDAASATVTGCVTTGTQTFAGNKSFSGNILPVGDATQNLGGESTRWGPSFFSQLFVYESGLALQASSYIYANGTNEPVLISEPNGLRIAPQTLPTCGTVLEGTLVPIAGSGGTEATQLCLCAKDGTNFEWINLLVPATRTGSTTACPVSGSL